MRRRIYTSEVTIEVGYANRLAAVQLQVRATKSIELHFAKRWVYNGALREIKMKTVEVANGTVDRTGPHWPFPQTAQYAGQGRIDEAANFVCKLPSAKECEQHRVSRREIFW